MLRAILECNMMLKCRVNLCGGINMVLFSSFTRLTRPRVLQMQQETSPNSVLMPLQRFFLGSSVGVLTLLHPT